MLSVVHVGITKLYKSNTNKASDPRPHSSPIVGTIPSTLDLKSRCQAIPNVEEFDNRSLSSHLLTSKHTKRCRGQCNVMIDGMTYTVAINLVLKILHSTIICMSSVVAF